MRCTNCGQENEKTDILCRFCASPLPETSAAVAGDHENTGASDTDDVVYKSTASRSKTSIIISAIIVLLLLSFAFLIYRRLTTDDKNASGIFQEETQKEPLLLPDFKTDPTQSPVLTTTSSTSENIVESAAASSSTSTTETSASTTETVASTSPSIRVLELTEAETEPISTLPTSVINSTTVVDSTAVAGGSTIGGTDAAAGDVLTQENTVEATLPSTSKAAEPPSETKAETEPKQTVRVHIYPDPRNFPLIRLYYAIDQDIDKDIKEDEEAPVKSVTVSFRIFEKLDDSDEWQEQEQENVFAKENSNIALVANFAQAPFSNASLKEALDAFISEMNLMKEDEEEGAEESGSQEADPGDEESNPDEAEPVPAKWDMFALINYGSTYQVETELTSNYADAKAAVDASTPLKGTTLLLHDALYKAIENIAEADVDHGSVVIITDGKYSGNTYTLDDVKALACANGIPINIIYIADNELVDDAVNPEGSGRHSEEKLRDFARNTRGDLFSVDSTGEDKAIQLKAALILALDRDREVDTFLTYKSAISSKEGSKHFVRLQFCFKDAETGEEQIYSAESEYTAPEEKDPEANE